MMRPYVHARLRVTKSRHHTDQFPWLAMVYVGGRAMWWDWYSNQPDALRVGLTWLGRKTDQARGA